MYRSASRSASFWLGRGAFRFVELAALWSEIVILGVRQSVLEMERVFDGGVAGGVIGGVAGRLDSGVIVDAGFADGMVSCRGEEYSGEVYIWLRVDRSCAAVAPNAFTVSSIIVSRRMIDWLIELDVSTRRAVSLCCCQYVDICCATRVVYPS